MNRRFFLAAGAGSLAIARLGAVPAFAGIAGGAPVARISIRRHLAGAGIPGACSNHGRRRATGGYTLAYALGGRR